MILRSYFWPRGIPHQINDFIYLYRFQTIGKATFKVQFLQFYDILWDSLSLLKVYALETLIGRSVEKKDNGKKSPPRPQ